MKYTGRYIKKLRLGRGLSQQELADKLFVSVKAVSKWETGRGLPSHAYLQSLADFFNVSVDELLGGGGRVKSYYEALNEKSDPVFAYRVQADKYRYIIIALIAVIVSTAILAAVFISKYNKLKNTPEPGMFAGAYLEAVFSDGEDNLTVKEIRRESAAEIIWIEFDFGGGPVYLYDVVLRSSDGGVLGNRSDRLGTAALPTRCTVFCSYVDFAGNGVKVYGTQGDLTRFGKVFMNVEFINNSGTRIIEYVNIKINRAEDSREQSVASLSVPSYYTLEGDEYVLRRIDDNTYFPDLILKPTTADFENWEYNYRYNFDYSIIVEPFSLYLYDEKGNNLGLVGVKQKDNKFYLLLLPAQNKTYYFKYIYNGTNTVKGCEIAFKIKVEML